ncbi:membrane protein [Dermacoccus sp. Ellin185]|nr:membrane protein [Dermacoccus sp. Ellin185]
MPARVVLRVEGPISPIIPSGGFRRWFDGCKVWLTFGSSYTARVSPRTYAQLFRIVATAEAISWAGLLTGMYFKYLTDAGDLGVRIFGPIHGGIFVAYVLITFLVSRALGWGRWTTLVGLACSVPPFATLAFEVWAQRSGQLMTPTTGSPDEPLPRRATTGGRV